MGEAAVDYLIGFIHGLDDAPADATEGAVELARDAAGGATRGRAATSTSCSTRSQAAIARTFEYAGPGYLAYIPGGGLYTAALADFVAQGVNRYVGLWQPSPAVVQIEENVTRWLCDLFDYPAGSQGLLLSGGSMANLSAMVTARHAKLGEDFLDGTYYVSEQAHASVAEGGHDRGVLQAERAARAHRRPSCGWTPTRSAHDDRARIARPGCGRSWWRPSAGTTNTGAIDPLDDDRRRRGEPRVCGCTSTGRTAASSSSPSAGAAGSAGIERSDSVTLDPHKGLFLPYGTGGLVVRDGEALRDAHYEGAAYLQDLPPTGELPNYSEYSAELSRDWRGLRVWMPLKLHGVTAFREALDEKLDLDRVPRRRVRATTRGSSSVGAAAHGGAVPARRRRRRDADGRSWRRINASKRVFLSSTMIHGRYVLRVVHREPPHAQGPDRRVHRDRRPRPPTSCSP